MRVRVTSSGSTSLRRCRSPEHFRANCGRAIHISGSRPTSEGCSSNSLTVVSVCSSSLCDALKTTSTAACAESQYKISTLDVSRTKRSSAGPQDSQLNRGQLRADAVKANAASTGSIGLKACANLPNSRLGTLSADVSQPGRGETTDAFSEPADARSADIDWATAATMNCRWSLDLRQLVCKSAYMIQ